MKRQLGREDILRIARLAGLDLFPAYEDELVDAGRERQSRGDHGP